MAAPPAPKQCHRCGCHLQVDIRCPTCQDKSKNIAAARRASFQGPQQQGLIQGQTGGGHGYHLQPQQILPAPVSNNRGRKRAVLCGVSYFGDPKGLKASSINDVNNMKAFLDQIIFPDSSILVLTEYERNPYRTPTKQNIISALRWLVKGCQFGDSLLFYYSGLAERRVHFGYVDEELCPVDYSAKGNLLAEEINTIIVKPLPPGVKLHAIIDVPPGGNFLDLPYLLKKNGEGYYWEERPIFRSSKGTRGGTAISFCSSSDQQTKSSRPYTPRTKDLGTSTSPMTGKFIQQASERDPLSTYGDLMEAFVPPSQEIQLASSQSFHIYAQPFTF